MRVIGHLPSEASALLFSDYLYVQGIGNQVDEESEGWGVWIHSEDEISRAKEILEAFRSSPDDPKYRKKAALAGARRAREAVVEEEPRERVGVEKVEALRTSMPYGVGALTSVLLVLCVSVHVLKVTGYEANVLGELGMARFWEQPGGDYRLEPGLQEIWHGEFWRLLTPVLIHADWLHLFFNLVCLFTLGSLIEARQSTGKLGLLFLVLGVFSNLAQYWYAGPRFYGMSGVAYGLLGYAWLKGKLAPPSGLFVHPQTAAIMLIWFGLCFSPVVQNMAIANGAHAAGLGLGGLWGILEGWSFRRRLVR